MILSWAKSISSMGTSWYIMVYHRNKGKFHWNKQPEVSGRGWGNQLVSFDVKHPHFEDQKHPNTDT